MPISKLVGKRIIITGGNGFLGGYFKRSLPHAFVPSLDISDTNAVGDLIKEYKADILINCAGKTGRPNVDWCEDNKMATLRSNVTGPLVLLERCLESKTQLVHIGSGCIYDAHVNLLHGNLRRCFSETDEPNFEGSFYSRTKSLADKALRDFPVLNLRLRMPFDGSPSPRNLIVKLAGYKRVLNEANSMTYIPDFIRAALTLTALGSTGTFNVVNGGVISPWEVMCMYKEIINPEHSFEALRLDDLPMVTRAARSNCALHNYKLESLGIPMLDVRKAMETALLDLKRLA